MDGGLNQLPAVKSKLLSTGASHKVHQQSPTLQNFNFIHEISYLLSKFRLDSQTGNLEKKNNRNFLSLLVALILFRNYRTLLPICWFFFLRLCCVSSVHLCTVSYRPHLLTTVAKEEMTCQSWRSCWIWKKQNETKKQYRINFRGFFFVFLFIFSVISFQWWDIKSTVDRGTNAAVKV